MMQQREILFTGGSGLLGSELKKLFPEALFPTSSEFNITNYEQLEEYIKDKNIVVLFHAAAFTSPPKCEEEPEKAIDANIIGTSNIVKLCAKNNIKLIYVSTDYVFKGDKGNYKEEDAVYPVNKYAWSKLGGECAVRMYDNSIIIRTTFGPNEFPYPKAFTDQWTSRETAKTIAKKMSKLINTDFKGVIHVAGERKTVYEYAKKTSPEKEIGELSIKDVNFKIPADTSLNIELYKEVVREGE